MKSDTPRTELQFNVDEGEAMTIRYGRMIQFARGLERQINAIRKAVDQTGTAKGNEHVDYTLPQRIINLGIERDYFARGLREDGT